MLRGNAHTVNKSVTTVNQSATGRRLLQTSWKDNIPEVQQISVAIASGQAATIPMDIQTQWSQGPFAWPPNYNYWATDNPCLAAQITWNITFYTFQVRKFTPLRGYRSLPFPRR